MYRLTKTILSENDYLQKNCTYVIEKKVVFQVT